MYIYKGTLSCVINQIYTMHICQLTLISDQHRILRDFLVCCVELVLNHSPSVTCKSQFLVFLGPLAIFLVLFLFSWCVCFSNRNSNSDTFL